jgi:hypothetical protein
LRGVAVLLVAATCWAAVAHAEPTERELRAKPLADASHAEALGLLLGRYMAERRWNEVLDEMMYAVAPRGAWGPSHPAWTPARKALAKRLQAASARRYAAETHESIANVVLDHYLDALTPDEQAEATAFFVSPGGRAWLAWRERFLEEQTSQNGLVADIAGNVLRSALGGVALEAGPAAVREVRARVPGIPPPSDKTYLGTVTMRADRALEATIEHFDHFSRLGTYALRWDPGEPQWRDVAAGVPGIAPGETRPLYRDARGRLSDRP